MRVIVIFTLIYISTMNVDICNAQYTAAERQFNQSFQEAVQNLTIAKTAYDYLLEAKKNIEQENYHMALNNLNDAIRAFPQHARAYLKRGKIKIELGMLEDAIQDFELALLIKPNIEHEELSLIDTFNRHKDAIAYFYIGKAKGLLNDATAASYYLRKSNETNTRTYLIYLRGGESYKDLVNTEIRTTMVNFSYYEINYFEVSNKVELVRNNTETFKDFIFPTDLVLYDDELTINVDDLYKDNLKFRALIIEEKIREFESVMTRISNDGMFDVYHYPENYAKAFAIYNRFGLEALRDYTNILQHYVQDDPFQDNRVTSALRRFRNNTQYRQEDIFKFCETFTVIKP